MAMRSPAMLRIMWWRNAFAVASMRVLRNKTFFFLNYEGFRRRAGITRITNVPTLAERAGNIDGQTITVNPVSAQIFDELFPKPNLGDHQFISSPQQTDDTDQFLIKIDQRLSE